MTTKEEEKHFCRLAEIGCVICSQPAEMHHLTGNKYRGMSQKANNYQVIPLCPSHHRTGGHGVAIHAGIQTWEAKFGSQEELLEKVLNILGIPLYKALD